VAARLRGCEENRRYAANMRDAANVRFVNVGDATTASAFAVTANSHAAPH